MEKKRRKELIDLCVWLDQIPLSRPRRNITRDFSDGVMAAEVVKHFFPKLVDLYNYTPTNSLSQKHSNWDCLNRKVLCKLNFCVSKESVNRIALNTAGVVEPILISLKMKIQKKVEQNSARKQNLRNTYTRNKRSHGQSSRAENHFAQPGREKKKYGHRSNHNFSLDKPQIQTYKDLPPKAQTLLCQKDQHILLLQNRVIRLRGLLQLKDKQIDMLKNPPKLNQSLCLPLLEQLPIQSFPNDQKTDSHPRSSGTNEQCSVSCTTNMEPNQQVSKQSVGNGQKTDSPLRTSGTNEQCSVSCTTKMELNQQVSKQSTGNGQKTDSPLTTPERNLQPSVLSTTNIALNQQLAKQTLRKLRQKEKTLRTTDGQTNKEELENLYKWIDEIPLSRPIKNISRDFSDGVLAAQIVKHFFPKLVYLHNYVPSHCTQQKRSNWDFLNRNVFSKLNFYVSRDSVNKITLKTAGVIVPVLGGLRDKIKEALEDKKT